MDPAEYHTMAKQEANYWWHKGRRHIIETVCNKFISKQKITIADIGCGTGGNFELLRKYGNVDGLDISEAALEYCKKRSAYRKRVLTSAENVPINEYDIITAFDVLEHLENDNSVLRAWASSLKPRGYILLTVPAYQWLFGPHDRSLHHKRRYTRQELELKARKAGFSPVYCSYFFFFTFPFLLLSRIYEKRKKTTGPVSTYKEIPLFLEKIFLLLSRLEGWLINKSATLPFGSSLIIIAQKQ